MGVASQLPVFAQSLAGPESWNEPSSAFRFS
jgi:hypothetical protein